MSLPINEIRKRATHQQLDAAAHWTADNLHVGEDQVTDAVAVAYVRRHYKAGQLEGWDGFVTDMHEVHPKEERPDCPKCVAGVEHWHRKDDGQPVQEGSDA